MAEAVTAALEHGQRLVVEAGTGTGKTYADLAPALLSGRRVIVSTGTKTLQDQLFFRDLPNVREALARPLRVSLLKGRANYLCAYRLRRAQLDARARTAWGERLFAIERWGATSERGELSEMGDWSGDAALVARVTSTAENCLGSRCPDFAGCFVARARRDAQAADVVVVNHHLLLADFALKREGFGEILPNADAVIIDEAHQLPEVAAQFFGVRVSSTQLLDLVRDVHEEARLLGDTRELMDAGEGVGAAALAIEDSAGAIDTRMTRREAFARAGLASAAAALDEALDELAAALRRHAPRAPGIASCSERADALATRWRAVAGPEASAEPLSDSHGESDHEQVRWVEPLGRGLVLHATPIRVAGEFGALMARSPGAWIFTSATLSAGDDFAAFRTQLGLVNAHTLQLQSPFDYTQQARLHLPAPMPDPNAAEYLDAVADRLLPILRASGGGAFMLCTSHRAVLRLAASFRALGLPLLVQGDESKARLLERFTAAGNAILVGTASFWEGVDVKGPALRVVAIDRLPFAAPGDPVQDARLAAIRARGGSPFSDDQLPRAITALRQGVGRLIRDPADRGLLVLCDPRLRTRGYGRRMLAALPAIPLVDEAGAIAWVAQLGRAA